MSLLFPDEPPPFSVTRPDGSSPFVLTVDHAGLDMPRAVGDLGVSASDRARHIGWDIGILGVSERLSALLDAPMVATRYSRLVIDCNRDPSVPTAFVTVSEDTPVPGNVGLADAARAARVEALFRPYHDAVAALLDRRAAAGKPTVLVAMHSFTPRFRGVDRPWHVGVLYGRDDRLARRALDAFRAEGDLVVGDNEPYQVTDLTDYTVPVHGERRGLLHVELEVRQDLIAEAAGQAAWAERLARLLSGSIT